MNGVALALALVLFLVCVIEMRRKPPFIGGEEGVPWNIPILLWKHQTTIQRIYFITKPPEPTKEWWYEPPGEGCA
jgi:hypothetical protein